MASSQVRHEDGVNNMEDVPRQTTILMMRPEDTELLAIAGSFCRGAMARCWNASLRTTSSNDEEAHNVVPLTVYEVIEVVQRRPRYVMLEVSGSVWRGNK